MARESPTRKAISRNKRNKTMQNWKTTLLGALTIIASLSVAGREFLTTGSLPDLGLVTASLLAGWGLITARDASN